MLPMPTLRAGLRLMELLALAAALLLADGLLRPAPSSAGEPSTAARLPSNVPAASVPETLRTPQALYITAREAFQVVTAAPDTVLLIDVRTTGEIVFGGIATPAARNIPYLVVDPDLGFDSARHSYKLLPNPDFVKAVTLLLEEKRLGRDTAVILYCTVGERSSKAARVLGQSGLASVYSMLDGFDPEPGGKLGPGWKASGLPWSLHLTPGQLYVSPTM